VKQHALANAELTSLLQSGTTFWNSRSERIGFIEEKAAGLPAGLFKIEPPDHNLSAEVSDATFKQITWAFEKWLNRKLTP
jgi:hypothetical protein